ncbi:trimeric LpxA-like protein [Kalaharituber pfeilii]|nr:trimeric LpxA-like protein [Kalaharituber pfeilii]
MPPRTRASAAAEPVTRPPVEFHASCVVDGSAQLTGTYLIRIGANSIVHPKARLNSTNGPITIGESCIINERCLIQAADASGIVLGDGVLVECNTIIEGKEVREGTDVEVGVRIGKGAVVGKHCKLCPMTEVMEQEVLPDYTVIYGYNERRKDVSGNEASRRKVHDRHIEALKILITSNHAKFKS